MLMHRHNQHQSLLDGELPGSIEGESAAYYQHISIIIILINHIIAINLYTSSMVQSVICIVLQTCTVQYVYQYHVLQV